MTIDFEETRAPHVTSRLMERVGRSYLLWFLLVPMFGYMIPFAAERVEPLNRISVSSWGQVLDYSYGLRGEDADIVIFGDSSAIYGADAMRLSQALGEKVVILPNTLGSLPIRGDRPLRDYLAQNKAPRLIVFYFAPWNLD